MTVTLSPAESETDTGLRRWKWTGDDLIRLGELGVLPPEVRFELMDGNIIEIMPPNPRHSALIVFLVRFLTRLLGEEVHVRQEQPIRLNEHFDPQPDLAVVRGNPLDYENRFPASAEVMLLIEIADTTLAHDRRVKLAAYAAAGIPEYWIVNLRDGQVEVYRDPGGPEYRFRRDHRPGDHVSPMSLPEIVVPAATLLGR